MKRSTFAIALASTLAFAAAGACGSSDSPTADDPAEAGVDAPGVADAATDTASGDAGDTGTSDGGLTTTCDGTGAPHAVVLAISGADEVDVLTQRGGRLIDNGLKFTSLKLPNHVAIRADGKEAVVAWGNVSGPYGVASFTIAPDGSSASLVKSVQLGTGRSPQGLDYVSNDRVVLAVSSSVHELVTLDRSNNAFAETARVAAPGAFPLQVLRRGSGPSAILPRTEFGTDTVTYVHLMNAAAGGSYVSAGSVGQVSPQSIEVAAHPSGNVVYSPTSDPSNRVTPTNLAGTGVLFSFAVSESGVATPTKTPLPRYGSVLAADPLGRFLVVDGNVYELDKKSNTPIVRNYVLLTAPLDPTGKVGPLLPETPPFPALLFSDMKISTSGHLLLAENMYIGSVPPEKETPLEIRAQTKPGVWTVCQTLYLPGSTKIAIAP